MTWDFTTLSRYLEYRESQQKVVRRSSGNFDSVPPGIHFIQVTLTDDNPAGSLSSLYTITVEIDPVILPPCPDGSLPPCIDETEPPLPAFLSAMSNTGEITLNFNDKDLDLQGVVDALNSAQSTSRRLQRGL
jgi:hypothetical protein